ncbi:hypothetical protein EH11_04220 [Bacillus subtilis]|nr:hypothetical protein EH11_04220 [Bacillus subtilis]
MLVRKVGKLRFSLINSAGIEPAFLVAEATRSNNAKLLGYAEAYPFYFSLLPSEAYNLGAD